MKIRWLSLQKFFASSNSKIFLWKKWSHFAEWSFKNCFRMRNEVGLPLCNILITKWPRTHYGTLSKWTDWVSGWPVFYHSSLNHTGFARLLVSQTRGFSFVAKNALRFQATLYIEAKKIWKKATSNKKDYWFLAINWVLVMKQLQRNVSNRLVGENITSHPNQLDDDGISGWKKKNLYFSWWWIQLIACGMCC